MTLFVRSATMGGLRPPRRRAAVRGVAATVLALGVLLASATSAAADPAPGHSGHLPIQGHPHTLPDCWLCIM